MIHNPSRSKVTTTNQQKQNIWILHVLTQTKTSQKKEKHVFLQESSGEGKTAWKSICAKSDLAKGIKN